MIVEWVVKKISDTEFKLVQCELEPMVNLPTLGGMSYTRKPMKWLEVQDGEDRVYSTRKEAQKEADELTAHHGGPLGCYPRPLRPAYRVK